MSVDLLFCRSRRTSRMSRGAGWLALAISSSSCSAQASTPPPAVAVNALFTDRSGADSPGCALSVVRDGHLLFARGYGQAIIEAGVANTERTRFNIASVSKQFTAYAVQLLAAEGKLSLSDDVRRYIPELHNFGTRITLDQMMHHRSGLRDQWALLNMKGRRPEDIITQADVLSVIFAQRGLNFEPGTRYAYSNSNYTLLATVVERVSGTPFAHFMAERVFAPLGMADSFIQDDFRTIRRSEASPYGFGPDRLPARHVLPYANYGATNMRSSAVDLGRWLSALMTPPSGSETVMAAMVAPDRVPDGEAAASGYASGLELRRYRGTAVVEHSGIDPGYTANVMMLPQHRFGVAILCNAIWGDPGQLSRRIADLYLGDLLAPEAPVASPPPGSAPAVPTPANGSGSHSVPDLTPQSMAAYEGRYVSTELDSVVRIKRQEEGLLLVLGGDSFDLTQPPSPMRVADELHSRSPFGMLRFSRDDAGRVSSFAAFSGRADGVRFERLADR